MVPVRIYDGDFYSLDQADRVHAVPTKRMAQTDPAIVADTILDMLHRRTFLRSLTIPLATPLLSAFDAPAKLKIAAVELLKLEGKRQAITGINQQPQVKPNDVYDEL